MRYKEFCLFLLFFFLVTITTSFAVEVTEKANPSVEFPLHDCPPQEINFRRLLKSDSLFITIASDMDKESQDYEKAVLNGLQINEFINNVIQAEDEESANFWRYGIQQSLNQFTELGLDIEPYRERLIEIGIDISDLDTDYYGGIEPPFEVQENPEEIEAPIEDAIAEQEYFFYDELLEAELDKAPSQLDWSNGGIYEGKKPEDERMDLRGITAKHFTKEDGTIEAIITAGMPLHYEEDGILKTIRKEIVPNEIDEFSQYPYANLTNQAKTFFPENTVSNGILIKHNEYDLQHFVDPAFVLLNGEREIIHKGVSNTSGTVDLNKIVYENCFTDTDILFTQRNDGLKQDIILNSPDFLSDIPDDADIFGYQETMILPDGWSYVYSEDVFPIIQILDANDNQVFTIDAPIYYDATYKDDGSGMNIGKYIVTQNENRLAITSIIPVEWLSSPDRVYPITIDPTTTLYAYQGGYQSTGTYYGNDVNVMICGYWSDGGLNQRGWSKFNTSTIPDGSAVSSVTLRLYADLVVSTTGVTVRTYSIETYYGTYGSASSTYYNELGNGTNYNSYYVTNTGSYGPTSLGSSAASTLQLQLPNNRFQVGLTNSVTYADYRKRFTSSSYISVTYTADPCACPPGSYYGTYYPSLNSWGHHSSSTTSTTLCRWYRMYLYSGYEYNFTTVPGVSPSSTANFDTYIEVYNSSCTRVAYDDDEWSTLQSFVSYCPTSSGYYWVKVRGYSSYYGSYTLGYIRHNNFGAPTSISVSSSSICYGSSTTITASGGYGGAHYITHGSSGTCGSFIRYNSGTWTPPLPSGWSQTYTIYTERRGTSTTNSCMGGIRGSGGARSTTLTVYRPSEGGTTTANYSTVCVGGLVTFSNTGQVGTFLRFQYRWDGSGSWIDWSTSDPYIWTANNPGHALHVRAEVKNGACAEAYSNTVIVNVVNDPTAPSLLTATPLDGTTICIGGTVRATFNAGSGGTGCGDAYRYTLNGGSTWATYTPGASLTASNAGTNAIQIQTRRLCSGNGCDGAAESWATKVQWNVVNDPVAPTITKNPNVTTVCVGASLSVTSSGGSGGCGTSRNEYRYSTNAGLTWSSWSTSIPGMTASSTGTNRYQIQCRRYSNGNGCDDPVGNTVMWTVVNDPVAPTITKNPNVTTVCVGAVLSATSSGGSGGCGTSQNQYRYSTNAGSTWSSWSTSIPSLTASSTGTDQYRIQCRRYSNGDGCNDPVGNTVMWTVVNDPVAPTITKSPNVTTVCVGATLTASSAGGSGGCGTSQNEYRYSTNAGSTWSSWSTSIPSLTASSTGTNQYRIQCRRYSNGNGCDDPVGNTVQWTVVNDPVAPTITKSPNVTTVCVGATLTATSAGGSGGCGTSQNQYRYSTNAGSTWSSWSTTIPSLTASVTGTSQYRIQCRRYSDGNGCDDPTGNTVMWTVVNDPTAPSLSVASPSDGTTICIGGTVSATFNAGSGGTGCGDEYRYTLNSGSTWATYTPGASLTASSTGTNAIRIQSRRLCSGNGCDGSAESWATKVQWNVVNDPSIPSLTKSPDVASVCVGASLSATASGSTGGTGSCNYEYQYRQPGSSTWVSGSSFTTSGTGTGYVRARRSCSGNGCDPSAWEQVSWTVEADPTLSSFTKTPNIATVCEGATLSGSASGSGGSGSCNIEYEYRNPGGSWTSCAGSFTAAGTGTAELRARRACTGPGCNESAWDYVNWSVQNDPSISVSGGGTVCWGDALTLTASYSGGTGSFSRQWQYYNISGTTWTNISGETAATFLADPSLFNGGSNTQFRCCLTCDGYGCNDPCSSPVWVNIYNNSEILGRWVGNASNTWSDCENWGKGQVPSAVSILIPNGSPYDPVVSSSVPSVTMMDILSGGELLIMGSGNLTNTNISIIRSGGSMEVIGGTWNTQDVDIYGDFSQSDGTINAYGMFLWQEGNPASNLTGGTINIYDGDFGTCCGGSPGATVLSTNGHTINVNYTGVVDWWNRPAGTSVTSWGNININNGTVTFNTTQPFDINGDLTIGSATSLSINDIGSEDIMLFGNWTNNGTFNAGTGKVTFDGITAAQTIYGTATTDFYHVHVTNEYGLNLNATTNANFNYRLSADSDGFFNLPATTTDALQPDWQDGTP